MITKGAPPKPKRAKILTLDALAKKLDGERAQKKKIVHCHGVFDLLHIGHVRHFTEAKAMGDVLVVTITQDEYVNKGPHRPAFPQNLRAEMLAALDAVDYVAINRWPTAVKTIELLKPDIYAKGPDYKVAAKDVSGGITKEEEAVRSVGGAIRFTEDIAFSSSNLLNRHMPQFDSAVNDFLEQLRAKYAADQVVGFIEKLRGLKVLVVGEAILDEYVYCDALGKSAKEPILALQYQFKDVHAGGALAIANHAAEFAKSVKLLTYLGAQNGREEFVRKSLKPNVSPSFIHKPDSPTIVKRRFVEKYLVTKLLEIYEMNDAPLTGPAEETFCSALEKALPEHDVVIAADFGHGLITPRVVDLLSRKAKFLAVNTQINAANIGFHTISKYPRADYVCIHEGEIRLDHRSREADIKTLIETLAARLSCETVMVTRGKIGTMLFNKEKGFFECPSFALKVVDRIGAGDAVFAVTSLCAAAKTPQGAMGFIGNLAGAQAVTIVGNSASISRVSMLKTIESLLK